MLTIDKFYINGQWVNPVHSTMLNVINPATEEIIAEVALGSSPDVDQAVAAAKDAFNTWSLTSREERLALLRNIISIYSERLEEIAQAITAEMGAPMKLAINAQAPAGLTHFKTSLKALESFEFEHLRGNTLIVKEAIGVCGFITPWNWPMNQIACKVAPALACGCTIVLKPSELAPLSAKIFTEIIHDAGVPAGVFNMINGDGAGVGSALATHPGIEMISLTGSTRAGISVSKSAADTIKRVTLELGGKSANLILDDADLVKAVRAGASSCFSNTGQSCNAPTRMLVPEKLHDEAVKIAIATAEATQVADPNADACTIGPLANQAQFRKVQNLIQQAIDDGTELVTGGTGLPQGLTKGFFVKPTVFANVSNNMLIAREEIFGPVLAIIPYRDIDHAVEIANDTPYGLAAYIQSKDIHKARAIARRLKAGSIHLNKNTYDPNAPFGGYKQSGNGRECGVFAFNDFLEIKGIQGYNP